MTILERIDELLKERTRGLDWEDEAITALNEYYNETNNPDDTIYHVDDDTISDFLAYRARKWGLSILKTTISDVKNGGKYVKFDAYGNLKSVDTDDLVELLEWAKEDLNR